MTTTELQVGSDQDLFDRLPTSIRDSLDSAQRAAIIEALAPAGWAGHPVNLRLSLPLPGRRVFFTLVGGAERRSHARLREERRHHPLLTAGNALFVLFSLTGMYAVALFATLLSTSILEF